ncbi:MAG: DUF3458 domain-containing protein, partial [Rhodobacteraceae bacterium]|nr:DUF3458 domain-containing protein [Paracoccaceae bacterium]
QLCLKEGLTVFRDQEFSSDMRSRPVKRISDVRLLKSHQFPEDAGPLAHPVRPRKYTEINNFYTATVYEKGAEVVRMLKTLLGPDGFKKGMDLYFARHDGDATTIEAFLACFAEATGTNLDHFALWYEQAGTPKLEAHSVFDETSGSLTIDFSQSIAPLPSQDTSKPAVLPIRFGLVGDDGNDMVPPEITGATVKDDTLILDQAKQTVIFKGLPSRPVPSLLRNFSAPVTLDAHLSLDDLEFLAMRDSDPFNRWQAMQTLASQELIRMTGEAQKGATPTADSALIKTFGTILEDETLDPAFKALALQLPGEGDLSREIGTDVDPDAIHSARATLRRALAEAHLDTFRKLVDARPTGAFSPDATAAGQRAFANQALYFISATRSQEAAELVFNTFDQADNMSDQIAALTLLVHDDLDQAAAALEAYRRKFEGVSLAMDKWFTVQATAPLNDGLERVQALTAHPLFDFTNPNRVRSLIHAFATGNLTQFARSDGNGFEFVADNVLAIDARNAQVASRLLTSFRSWRAFEAERSSLAKAALIRISTYEKLSRDSKDIVDRCLQ